MKYRKKPVVIEAFKWTGRPDQTEDPVWIVQAVENGLVWFINESTPEVRMGIRTPEGDITASPGDYVIKGVKGEIYPCKSDIFEMTYEPVEE